MDWNLKLRLRRFEGFYADKQFMWVDPEWRIRNGRDYANWKSMFAPKYIQIRHANRPRHRYNGEKSRTAHCFGESSQVKLEVKNEYKQEFKTGLFDVILDNVVAASAPQILISTIHRQHFQLNIFLRQTELEGYFLQLKQRI